MDKYFRTKSITFCNAIQYITGKNYYKMNDKDGNTVYSFETDDIFNKKIKLLDELKFMK